jgi:RNA polymerase sigma factor (sigma-70 family)
MQIFSPNEQEKKEFQDLLLENMNSLYNLAYRLTYTKEEAADLVQEASMRAYRFFHKFEKGTNFKGWACTILRNLFINQYRKVKKEPTKVNYDDLENYISAPETTGFEEEVFGEGLQSVIDDLSEDLKTVITLYYVEGFSYKEISKIMKCPIGTVMSRLHMAKQILKKKLLVVSKKEGDYYG